jgi:hypothetical protein
MFHSHVSFQEGEQMANDAMTYTIALKVSMGAYGSSKMLL